MEHEFAFERDEIAPDRYRGVAHVRAAIAHLQYARNHLRESGSIKCLDRVRTAIKSAEGAERHQERKLRKAKQA